MKKQQKKIKKNSKFGGSEKMGWDNRSRLRDRDEIEESERAIQKALRQDFSEDE